MLDSKRQKAQFTLSAVAGWRRSTTVHLRLGADSVQSPCLTVWRMPCRIRMALIDVTVQFCGGQVSLAELTRMAVQTYPRDSAQKEQGSRFQAIRKVVEPHVAQYSTSKSWFDITSTLNCITGTPAVSCVICRTVRPFRAHGCAKSVTVTPRTRSSTLVGR